MSNHRFCCCGSDCTSSYKVFVPCGETFDTVDDRSPAVTLAAFTDEGLTEGTVYLYDSLDGCDDFCGTWQCVPDADDDGNICHPDGGGGLSACPACGEDQPPYRFVRPNELAGFWPRFTEVDDCCDDVCPSDCSNQGNVVPSDCANGCFDWNQAFLSANLIVNKDSSSYPAEWACDSGTITAELQDVSASNVVPTVVNGELVVTYDLSLTYFRSNPSYNHPADCSYPPTDYFCCDECGGESGTCPQTWTVTRTGLSIKVPCMQSGFGQSSSSLTRPPATCSGFVSPSAGTNVANPSGTSTDGSPAGWDAVSWPVFKGIYGTNINPSAMPNVPGSNVCPATLGRAEVSVELQLSLNSRPEDCP